MAWQAHDKTFYSIEAGMTEREISMLAQQCMLEGGALANVTDHFNEATAKQYRDAAVQELTAAGATLKWSVTLASAPHSV